MKNALKFLWEAKDNLLQKQEDFELTLEKNYPFLVTHDLTDLRKDLSDEMDILLSSCVKRKSTRIEIPSKNVAYGNSLVLTRKPGLKEPRHSYPSWNPEDVTEISSEGNLIMIDDDKKEGKIGIIELSRLKNHGGIDTIKLEKYYSFMSELVMLMKTFVKYNMYSYRYNSEDDLKTRVGKDFITLRHVGFSFNLLNESVGKDRYDRFYSMDSERISQFDSEVRQRGNGAKREEYNPTKEPQKYLKYLIDNWEIFEKVLSEEEMIKKKLVDTGEDLKTRLLEYNKPYKILEKLLIH